MTKIKPITMALLKAYKDNNEEVAKFLLENVPKAAAKAKEWILKESKQIGWVDLNAPRRPLWESVYSSRFPTEHIGPHEFFDSLHNHARGVARLKEQQRMFKEKELQELREGVKKIDTSDFHCRTNGVANFNWKDKAAAEIRDLAIKLYDAIQYNDYACDRCNEWSIEISNYSYRVYDGTSAAIRESQGEE